MTRVFVDTSALLALIDADDPRQGQVRAAFAGHRESELVTHGYVVAESLAVIRRRFGVDGAITLLDDVLPPITVLPVDVATLASAQRAFRASPPSGTSFVDRVSLEVMKQEGVGTVLALDTDFGQAGIAVFPSTAPDEPQVSDG